MMCAPLCDCLHWDSKLKTRSYVEVQENRVETNYAFTCCFGQSVCDDISVIHFDKLSDSVKVETCCTPFHFWSETRFSGQKGGGLDQQSGCLCLC